MSDVSKWFLLLNTPAEVFQPGLMQLGERSVPVKGLDTYVTVQTSYSLGQILHVGRHSIVQRATHNATGILVTTKRPITVGKKMFEKYAREIVKTPDTQMVVTNHFDGESLDHILQTGGFTLIEFLFFALDVVEAIGEIHLGGVVHQQLTPNHILYNKGTRQIRIIDFSLSTLLNKVRPVVSKVNNFSDHYEYISPEQTGRMNREVDYRTDHYTLGVVFHRILTGSMPFTSKNTTDLFYEIIARTPNPASSMNQGVSLSLSYIVLKLLSKSMDNRYQSTYGIKCDLQRCLEETMRGENSTFIVGQHDVRSIFQVSQKMYGREQERQKLLHVFEDVSNGVIPSQLVLVGGHSGIGKTLLINEVQRPLLKNSGQFISGKVDQFSKGIPYASLIQAFRGLIRMILMEPAERIEYWKKVLLQGLNGKGQAIIDTIPEVELIIGPQPELPVLGSLENLNRFKAVFVDFISVIAQKDHPLILFLDDLQWADTPTLTLVETVMLRPKMKYLMIIGAYRSNEVGGQHPLSVVMSSVREKKNVVDIILKELSEDNVKNLLTDTLRCTDSRLIDPLASIVMAKTKGNPFFTNSMLMSLSRDHLIRWHAATGKWVWDIKEILSSDMTDDVVVLMKRNIQALPQETLRTISMAASIGNTFDVPLLSTVMHTPIREVVTALWPAVKKELLLIQGEEASIAFDERELDELLCGATIRFLHDRVQQAAYELIPQSDRPSIHLDIGRTFLSSLPSDKVEERVFEILPHFKLSSNIITDAGERDRLASLCLTAGEKAKKSSAYAPGVEYSRMGIKMMGEDFWERDYDRALSLHKILAECLYLSGDFATAESLYLDLVPRCKSVDDTASVYFIQATQFEYQQRYSDVVVVLMKCLQLYNIDLPIDFLDHSDEIYIEPAKEEFAKMKKTIDERSISSFVDIPEANTVSEEQSMKAFAGMWAALYIIGRNNLRALAMTKAVNYAMGVGRNHYTAIIYSNWVSSVPQLVEDYSWSQKVVDMAFALLPIYSNDSLVNRALFGSAWGAFRTMSAHVSVPLLREALDRSIENADVPYMCYCGDNVLTFSWHAAVPLPEVEQLFKRVMGFMESNHMHIGLHLGRMEGWKAVEKDYLQHCETFILSYGGYWSMRLREAFWTRNQDFHYLLDVLHNFHKYRFLMEGYYSYMELNFLAQITMLRMIQDELWKNLSQDEKQFINDWLVEGNKNFAQWTKYCPSSNEHKKLIIHGVAAEIEGRPLEEVLSYYSQAVQSAQEHKFPQYEALALEYTGSLLHSKLLTYHAERPIKDAHRLYAAWGSKLKTEQLENDFPSLFANALEKRRTISENDVIDQIMISRVNEAISLDMNLEQLLSIMMKEIIRNSGAQSGLFMIRSNDDFSLVLEGTLDHIKVDINGTPLGLGNGQKIIPAIVNLVARTGAPFLADDLQNHPEFGENDFVRDSGIKSVLCAPLMKNGAVKGIVYLENSLSNNVFNQQRGKVVLSIAVQISVHLESAKFAQFLEKETNQLKAVKTMMEEFVDVLCHELRNPLNGIFGSKQVMEEQFEKLKGELFDNINVLNVSEFLNKRDVIQVSEVLASLTDQEEMLRAISISSDHLKEIVDTVLTVSALDNKSLSLQISTFDPKEVLKKASLMFKPKLQSQGIVLTEQATDENIQVNGDRHRLMQILINVISNALKTISRGNLNLSLRYEVLFEVKDNGDGMAPSEVERLFRRFSRGSDSPNPLKTSSENAGLGLSFARELTSMMDGEIIVESKKGVGTVYRFYITCTKADNIKKRRAEDTYDDESEEVAAKRARSKHILIVEDNTINQKLLQRILVSKGFTVEIAENGQVGVEKFLASISPGGVPFDAILMDFEMPIMNGIEATKRIRQLEEQQKLENPASPDMTPIIGVSANTREAHSQKAFSVGMDAYIHKPFIKKDILDAIELKREGRKFC
ncbi:ATP-binding region ATPase domain protein [Planoprotostelium fungivorum]|uniref:ATP-binding region ATPase domain protein n=1 Tax=Planoprotostelium fungivorum TaxID=1890364 RepID=A0A2P6MZJ4_9EUKA|nr:ATP-binding region ATPase domain protein [Planoprotostelium fungivorum]